MEPEYQPHCEHCEALACLLHDLWPHLVLALLTSKDPELAEAIAAVAVEIADDDLVEYEDEFEDPGEDKKEHLG